MNHPPVSAFAYATSDHDLGPSIRQLVSYYEDPMSILGVGEGAANGQYESGQPILLHRRGSK